MPCTHFKGWKQHTLFQLSLQWLILYAIWYSLLHNLLYFIPPLIVSPMWKSLFVILQICRWFTRASGTHGLWHGWFTAFIHKWGVDTVVADSGVATGSASFTSLARTWSWCRQTTWPSSKATWVDTGPVFSITTPGSQALLVRKSHT